MTLRTILLIFSLLLLPSSLRAEVGLVDACVDENIIGGTSGDCANATRAWVRPTPDTVVLGCPSTTPVTSCTWGSATVVYQRFADWNAADWIWTCALDIEPGVWPTTTADPCGSNSVDKPRIAKSEVIVAPMGTGVAELRWTPPTENTDGSPLTDLAGYEIYYGCTEPGSYSVAVNVADPAATAHSLSSLPNTGTCYFAAAAYNVEDVKSELSNEVSKLMSNPDAPEQLEVLDGELVTVEEVVYTSLKQPDANAVIPVGTVPAGTACLPNHAILVDGVAYFAVPAVSVEWAALIRPDIVFARCGN